MQIWLITIGEPLPIDEGQDRLLRTGILAKHMSQNGHQITWWSSSFDHIRKRHRVSDNELIEYQPNLDLRLLHGRAYSRNLSWQRISNHRQIAQQFRQLAPTLARPDLILCSWPTLELCVEATRFGKQMGVPVVLDVRDMWPDAIVDLAPRWLRPLARLAMHKAYRNTREAATDATAIMGITDPIVGWALGYSGRSRSPWDRDFPMAYSPKSVTDEAVAKAKQFWNEHGICENDGTFVACFFGTIGRHFEIEPIISAAKKLLSTDRNVKFVICGEGPELEKWRRMAAGCDNLLLPGWVGAAEIKSLMQISRVGLAPYHSSWDFRISIPNKPIEYMSAGLPVLSSLQGVLAKLLEENQCGLTYENGQADDLVASLVNCYDHRDFLESMSRNSSRLFREKFVAESVYEEMQNHLFEISQCHEGLPAKQRAA